MNISDIAEAIKRRYYAVDIYRKPINDSVMSALYARSHFFFKLNDGEKWWRDHAAQIKFRGYRLRKRFRPGWKPSWLGTDLNPYILDDGCEHNVSVNKNYKCYC